MSKYKSQVSFGLPMSAYVRSAQQANASRPYTVTIIGGKAELAQWKAAQAISEAAWQAAQESARLERRGAAIIMVQEQLGRSFTDFEKVEMAYILGRSAKPKSELAPLLKIYSEEQQKLTLVERLAKRISAFWDAANL